VTPPDRFTTGFLLFHRDAHE